MKNAKKILITTTTREFFIFRRGNDISYGFCPHCPAIEQILSELKKEGKSFETFSSENLSTDGKEKSAEMEFDGDGFR